MRMALILLVLLVGLTLRAWGEDPPAPAPGSGTQDSAVAEKLKQIDEKLQEIDKARADLEALKKELMGVAGVTEPPAAPPPVAPAAAPPKPKQDTFTYLGYLQTQYVKDNAVANTPQFQVRRLYQGFRVRAGSHTRGMVLLDTALRGVTMLDAWAEGVRGDYALKAGQFPVPFGYEIAESSSVRTPLEFARALTTMFPGAYEQGLVLTTNPDQTWGGTLTAGFLNGNGINTADNNPQKDFLANYRQYIGKHASIYGAYVRGLYTTTPVAPAVAQTFQKQYFGVGGRYTGDHVGLQTEIHWGQGHPASGGAPFFGAYGQASYRTGKETVFARYEYFDPNRTAANDLWRGPLIGISHQFSARNKITAEVDFFENEATAGSDTRMGIRWQTKW
ncbi:MAG TPA: hypothetical protein PLD23_14075 [Armatimonadota bacterium]|nr:hypothetical protein [Armatimonadota bacterium]